MMFRTLSIETSSCCNRRCASCMRQTEPNKRAMASRLRQVLMPGDMVRSLLDQAKAMGFRGEVYLSYYNEPLLDGRIHDLGRYAKRLGFARVGIATNGDCLNAETAKRLDGCFDELRVSLYEGRTRERTNRLHAMFPNTRLRFTPGLHRWTHYAPGAGEQIAAAVDEPCYNVANNMIVDHCGDVIACCDEIIPHFDLGNVYESLLKDLWAGKQALIRTLRRPGGRRNYPYCTACARQRRARARYKVVPA